MPNPIPLNDWLDAMDAEYLTTFIRDGGATVKFVVAPEDRRAELAASLRERLARMGYALVELNAATTTLNTATTTMRAHMPQDIFFAMANQLDWRLLARRAVLRLAAACNYRIDGVDPVSSNVFDAIAQASGLETQSVIRGIRPEIEEQVAKNYRMPRDFRAAMSHLCEREDSRGGDGYVGQALLDWLRGPVPIRNVRQFSIHTPINRTTARYFIEAALYWVRFAGCAGTVILFDNSRVTVGKNPKDGMRYYTRAMAIDHYELLREFIDGVDRLTSTLMVTTTSQEFLDEDPRSPRGYGIYQALRTRVMDDVRDRNLVNPVASLVRIA